jgi:Family of unknown function (DUF6582)
MSWEELLKLRENINTELGEDVADGDIGELSDSDLIEALTSISEIKEAKQPGEKQGAPKSPPKGYPSDKGKYADPTNYKYPLDTEAHARAALSYFSKPKNRSGYSPEEQKFMWERIIAAAKKFGIDLSDDVKKHAGKLGNSNSDGGEVIEMEMKEQELADLIGRIVNEKLHEQTVQNPGGTLGQGQKGSGAMESYTPQVRVPPDIDAINTQLENFKQLHAQHEASNTYLKSKLSALQKQVTEMSEAFQKMQQGVQKQDENAEDSNDDGGDGNAKNTESTTAKAAKATDGAKAAGTKKTGKGDGEEDDSDSEDSRDSQDSEDASDSDSEDSGESGDSQQEKLKDKNKERTSEKPSKKKVKEQVQTAHAEGLVATSDMTEGNGVTPPGFGAEDSDSAPRSFGDVMNRATRQRRRGIGATA